MYTKGPWKRAGNGNLIYASTKTQHGNVNRFSITVTAPKGVEGAAPPEELEANVQLIAACPDMYEALKEVFNDLHCNYPDCRHNTKQVNHDFCPTHRRIYHVLAKAEGRA